MSSPGHIDVISWRSYPGCGRRRMESPQENSSLCHEGHRSSSVHVSNILSTSIAFILIVTVTVNIQSVRVCILNLCYFGLAGEGSCRVKDA